MGVEQRPAAAALAAIVGARRLLADQLLPDVRHLDRRVAVLGDQPDAHRVGLGLHRAAVLEQRQDRAELGQLDIVAEIDARRRRRRLPRAIAPIAKMSVLRRMSRQLRIMCRRRKWPDSCAITPASCASLRIRSSRPEKTTAKPVGNIIALNSGMRAR